MIPFARGLRLGSFYALAVAALASLGAVISGIALTKGDMWSRGDFGWHHRFVWPAFRLLLALALWRLVFGGELVLSGGSLTMMTRLEIKTSERGWGRRCPEPSEALN